MRASGFLCLGDNSADGREHILDAMVKLGDQDTLALLGPLAFGDIDVDANYPLWAPIAGVGNEAARFDPSNFASANDTILRTVLPPPLAECLLTERTYAITVLWQGSGLPRGARTNIGPFGQAVDGRITLRNLHPICVGVIGVAADEASLCRQSELHVAFSKCQLRVLALANVAGKALDAQEPPGGIKLALCRLLQPYLSAIRANIADRRRGGARVCGS